MYSLRRAFGNDEAKRRLVPLRDHPNEDIGLTAADALKRIERSRRSPQSTAR
jgi:hypothetical protein